MHEAARTGGAQHVRHQCLNLRGRVLREQRINARTEAIAALGDLRLARRDNPGLVLLAHALRANTRSGHRQFEYACRIMDREALRDAAAERIAEDVDAIEL